MNVGKVGMELEIEVRRNSIVPEPWYETTDGSIHTHRHEEYNAIELVSAPMMPHEIEHALQIIKPILGYANDSMGFHVHISPKKYREYQYLLSSRFIKHAAEHIDAYRLRTNDERLFKRYDNRFCRFVKSIPIDEQAYLFEKHNIRYSFVNFPMLQHGTVEFRIFPSTSVIKKLIEYTNLAIMIVNSFNEYTFEAKECLIEDDDQIIEKEVIECVL